MAIVNPSNFLPGGNEHEGKVFDTIGYEKALKETGYTAESAEQWWKEHPDGVGYTHHSSIELDDNTGKITIKAPEWFLESETYNQYFDDDILTGLGRLYAQNKDAKLQMADGTEKTVKEIIESWNNDLPKLVKAQESYEKMKKGVGEKFGEEAANNWTLGTYQLAGTSAYSGRDDDYLVIPNSILNNPNWSFLNDLEGLDKETGYITKKDFGEEYYHLDALRDLYSESPTSISKLKKDVARAIQNFEGSDMTEYAKLIAFNNFLSGEAAEGASNTPKGDLLNKVTIDAHAFYEAFYRATAATANNLVNNLGSLALAPFSVVDWIGGKTEGYQPKFIIDEVVGVTGDIIGDNLIPGAETVAEFLENEKNRRGDIYALTDSTASLIYNLAYMGTYTVETVLQSIAKTRLLINGVTLGITGTSVAKGIPKVTEAIQRAGMLGAKTADGETLWTTTAQEAVKANSAMTSGGVSQPVADLLTGMGGYSTWDKINLIGSLNPAELINGAYLYNQYIGQVGEDLAIIGGAGKAGAAGYEQAYAEMLKRNASMWMAQGKWGDINTTAEKIAYLRYLQPKFEAIYNTGNALLQTAAKVVTVLNGYAKYIPSVYYVSQVLIGTALSESDSIRRLMQSSDSNEQRDILWGMIARTALGWTIGMVVGRVVNKVFNGDFDQAVESANLGATEKIAKGVTAVRDRVDQFHMLVHGGKDWVDNINNPVKKSVVKFNQSLAKSQEYMAKAADMVRAEGGTEIAARAATKTAIDQMKANQNAIDLMQNPEWQVASWHTDAYPAYNNASNVFTGLTNDVSKMLTDLGLNIGVKPTAIIGGVATNADLPQDVVNYMARALQRASYLRDDFDVSNVLVPIGQSIANMQSQYKIVDPRLIKERDIAKKVMADFEGKYPKALVDLIKNKWVPAAQNAAYQLNQSIIGTGYYLRSQEEGWRKSGMWGQNNELWFPLQRVTDAQKDFEEAARNPMSIIKSGAIKRRSTDPKHLAPGSDEMTDFVHPMTTWKMHEFQQAVQLSINNWVHVNMTNPFVKNVTKLDGSQVGAAVTYDDLKPHYEKSVLRSLNATKQKLDESGLVNDMVDKQKMETRLKHAKKAVADAKETWENIPNVEVNITNAARSRTIDTLPENVVDNYLDKLEVPFEGEKIDTRKWLNSKVPGFDILEWSLLGRDHTNGLVSGGLYEATVGRPLYAAEVKAYIVNIDDLAKILGYDLDNVIPTMGKYISMHINNNTGKGVLPVRLRGTGDGDTNDFFMQMRWGHNGDKKENWVDYLQQLKENGVENVPIAVIDTRGRSGLEDISSSIAKRIGYIPTDITDDIKTAFSEFGKIPFYRGQKGLGQFNMNEQRSSRAVGNAYWIAPNASYTDTYGKDKIAGYIPVKYFLSDKEKAAFVQKGKYELEIARKELWPKIVEEEQKLEKQILKELEKSDAPGKELVDQQFSAGLITESEKPVVAASSLISSGTSSQKNKALKYRALYRIKNAIDLTDEDKKVLAKMKNGEEVLRYMKLDALLGGVPLYTEYDPKDIQDYRVLAELTGKPVIDISNDGFADGTAFFYYKDINPEFDKDIGGQLVIQEAGTLRWPDGVADEMAQEWFDETTLGGFLNMLEEKFPDVSGKIERVLDGLKDGKAAGDPVRDESDLVLEIAEDIKNEAPGLSQTAHVLGNRIWTHAVDGYDLDTSLTDMGMSPARYYGEHDVAKLLEEVGYENPDIVTQEEASAWDAINPSSPNYPTYTDQDLAEIR